MKSLLPYLADTGRVVFAANAAVALFAAFTEYLRPGFVVQSVAPTVFVFLGIASGVLAIMAPTPRPSRLRLALYAVCGVLAAALVGWATWYYFSSVPDARSSLAMIAAATVAYAFAAFTPSLQKDYE